MTDPKTVSAEMVKRAEQYVEKFCSLTDNTKGEVSTRLHAAVLLREMRRHRQRCELLQLEIAEQYLLFRRARDELADEVRRLRAALTKSERELVRLFTVLPINGPLPCPSIMQECQAALLPNTAHFAAATGSEILPCPHCHKTTEDRDGHTDTRSCGLDVTAGSEISLLTRLQNHLSMMAPHQRDRYAGKLLIEATHELAKLTAMLSRCLPVVERSRIASCAKQASRDYEDAVKEHKAAEADARSSFFERNQASYHKGRRDAFAELLRLSKQNTEGSRGGA